MRVLCGLTSNFGIQQICIQCRRGALAKQKHYRMTAGGNNGKPRQRFFVWDAKLFSGHLFYMQASYDHTLNIAHLHACTLPLRQIAIRNTCTVMGTRAAILLKQTFLTLLSFPYILSKLLRSVGETEKDLESQISTPHLTFEDEVFSTSHREPSEEAGSSGGAAFPDRKDRCSIGLEIHGEGTSGKTMQDPPLRNCEKPTCSHSSDGTESCPALAINQDMIFAVEEVMNSKRTLRKHEKQYEKLLEEIRVTGRSVDRARKSLENLQSKNDVQRTVPERVRSARSVTARILQASGHYGRKIKDL